MLPLGPGTAPTCPGRVTAAADTFTALALTVSCRCADGLGSVRGAGIGSSRKALLTAESLRRRSLLLTRRFLHPRGHTVPYGRPLAWQTGPGAPGGSLLCDHGLLLTIAPSSGAGPSQVAPRGLRPRPRAGIAAPGRHGAFRSLSCPERISPTNAPLHARADFVWGWAPARVCSVTSHSRPTCPGRASK